MIAEHVIEVVDFYTKKRNQQYKAIYLCTAYGFKSLEANECLYLKKEILKPKDTIYRHSWKCLYRTDRKGQCLVGLCNYLLKEVHKRKNIKFDMPTDMPDGCSIEFEN